MKAKSIIFIITSLALLVSIYWFLTEKSTESLIATLVATSALIGEIFIANRSTSQPNLSQKGGKNSKNFQSGRDLTIKK